VPYNILDYDFNYFLSTCRKIRCYLEELSTV
jgi:hypothetical protein